MGQTLHDFFADMDQHRERVPLDELVAALREVQIDMDELRPFAHFDAARYRRNLVHAGPGYQALLLCWRAGQRSPIHDHHGSSCAVRVLVGTLVETIFDRTEEGYVYATRSNTLAAGDVCGSEDSDIHQVSNLQPAGRDLMTLHIYSPPLLSMGVYSLTESTAREEVDPIFEFAMGSGI
ncbi:MAG: cysteine dioxygenase family protein [Phycisphaerales bacterium]